LILIVLFFSKAFITQSPLLIGSLFIYLSILLLLTTENTLAILCAKLLLVPFSVVVQFDPAAEPGDACSDGTNYICHVPFTSSSLDFSTVESTVSCDLGTGICTVNFINVNFATLGAGPIVFAATTPFGIDTTTPFIPSVAINGGTNASVPEPSSLWFAAIAVLACLGLRWRRQSLRLSAAN